MHGPMSGHLDLFRALADSTRLRIVHLLRAMELAVGEVALVMGQSQPRVSRHVRILADAGLIERRKEGSWVFLGLNRGIVSDALMACLDAMPMASEERLWIEADRARLAAVRAERTRLAEDYFATHAEQWDALRSLHVAEAEVEAAMVALLEGAPLGHMLDIGTGTGRIANLFADRARDVIGIDRSADMLRLARAQLPPERDDKVRFVAGDFYALPVEDAVADTVVLHLVLHYAQEPERAISEIARVLAPGGRLLLVDFAPHEHEELRVRHAHARLGFSDARIESWLADVGIATQRTETLAGGALTVKLWLGVKT